MFVMFQYWGAWNNYNTALSYLVTVPKYRIQAMDIAKSQGLIDTKRKKDRHKTKVSNFLLERKEVLIKDEFVLFAANHILGSWECRYLGKETSYKLLELIL